MRATHNDARRIYPEVNLIDFESAAREALTRLHPLKIERVWDDGEGRTKILKHEGFFIDCREIKIDAAPEKILNVIAKLAEQFEVIEADHLSLAHLRMKIPVEGWMEWHVSRDGIPTCLTQIVYFTPRGPGGFLCWYLLHPFFSLAFHGLLKNIARKSVVK